MFLHYKTTNRKVNKIYGEIKERVNELGSLIRVLTYMMSLVYLFRAIGVGVGVGVVDVVVGAR